jgi:Mg/Co/Ni transporter MgtE
MAEKKINVDKLLESWFQISTIDDASLDEALIEHGYNPKVLETKGVQKIRQLLFKQTVTSKKLAVTNYYQRALALIQETKQQSRDSIFKLLQQKSPALQFRSLEKLDDESLQQILSDAEVLELIEKLEKGEI